MLIDSGARANAITPAYCRQHQLKVRPVNELATNPTSIPVSGIGGFTQALGYAIINVRIEGIGSYNEEQVVLVIEDVSGLGMRVPVILGDTNDPQTLSTAERVRIRDGTRRMATCLALL